MKFPGFFPWQKTIGNLLRWIGRQTPNIPYVRAIPNRVLKPIHATFELKGGVVDVLGFKMLLEPTECVDGNLWFAPQLYDRDEINYLRKRMPQDGVFIDVGANIGFWALYFAHLYPNSRICAIEANPSTFSVLLENIEINVFCNIRAIHAGVADCTGELPLYCNYNGNRGADSFVDYSSSRGHSVMVAVRSLFSILVEATVTRIDVLKIDIEGFEVRVLDRFFLEAPCGLWPRYICVEISHVPEVVPLLETRGYRNVLLANENCVFALQSY